MNASCSVSYCVATAAVVPLVVGDAVSRVFALVDQSTSDESFVGIAIGYLRQLIAAGIPGSIHQPGSRNIPAIDSGARRLNRRGRDHPRIRERSSPLGESASPIQEPASPIGELAPPIAESASPIGEPAPPI